MILPFRLLILAVIYLAYNRIEFQRGEGVRIHRKKEGRR